MPLWISFHHPDQWHPAGSLRLPMMGVLINHRNWKILHTRAFMLSQWLSSLRKMFDKMLIIQIKFKTHCVSRCCIMNNTKKLKTVFQNLKIAIQLNKKKAALSLMTKGSANMHLCGFPFILLVNINWNNRCCLFLLELCQLQPLVGYREKAMAPHSSTLAWEIPWTEEPGRLQSMGSLRVGHDWVTSLSLFTFMPWRRKWQPTPVFLPGESQGQRSLLGCHLWVTQSRTWPIWLSSSSWL